jgi:hypothetical protein
MTKAPHEEEHPLNQAHDDDDSRQNHNIKRRGDHLHCPVGEDHRRGGISELGGFFPHLSIFKSYRVSWIRHRRREPCLLVTGEIAAHQCRGSTRQIENYRQKIPGPLSDRIDLHVEAPLVDSWQLALGYRRCNGQVPAARAVSGF